VASVVSAEDRNKLKTKESLDVLLGLVPCRLVGYLPTSLHGAKTQNIIIFTAVKTSNLTKESLG
jgi:hypothetical protein